MRINDSIFRVSSSDPLIQQFGTAFAFCRAGQGAYFLTCRHVIADVGGPDRARVGNYPAEMIASGSEGGLDDVAVLRVRDPSPVPILRLGFSGEIGSAVRVTGFRAFAQGFLVRPIRGILGERIGLESTQHSGRVLAWDLAMIDDFDLERGYSGAPVIDENSGEVMAVASHRLGGRRGIAISLEILEEIWPRAMARIQHIHTDVANEFSIRLFNSLGIKAIEIFSEDTLRMFQVSPEFGFSAFGARGSSRSSTMGEVKSSKYYAVVSADDLSKQYVAALLNRAHSYSHRRDPEGAKVLNVLLLYTYGYTDEMADFTTLRPTSATTGIEPVDKRSLGATKTYRNFWILDFKKGQIDLIRDEAMGHTVTLPLRNVLESLVEHLKREFFL